MIARIRELFEASGGDDQRTRLLNELDAAETPVARLTDAIAATDRPIAELVTQLQHADSRRQELARALSELGAAPHVPVSIGVSRSARRETAFVIGWRCYSVRCRRTLESCCERALLRRFGSLRS